MTRAAALLALRKSLAAAGVDEAALDARILLLHGLGIDATELAARPAILLTADQCGALADLARRRLSGEPIGRILGERQFWGLPFRIGPATLEPRADTETVVAAALSLLPEGEAPRILDLGTGSGCILVALLSERPQASGVGSDRSAEALAVARANARQNGVGERAHFVAADWGAPLAAESFDLVVSNPPYIATPMLAALAVEVVGHDPIPALDGGDDGLDAYRRILPDCVRLLAPGGSVVVEIGRGQAEDVAAIGTRAGLEATHAGHDLSGIVRALTFTPRCSPGPDAVVRRRRNQENAC